MNQLTRNAKDIIRILILFTVFTSFFYMTIRMVHDEYEKQHRYDPPAGSAVKVFQSDEQPLSERLSIFFQLGE
ncbi:DUF4227 family protein [Thalassobacillus sp. CUG 92003]|uniref:DUF4227 family protein n=1 Tax=Thalassobacillus sp. CUG 92003 TaxID=2736641 RepID=UPI0015E7B1E0|nr:DUF4227 family protein [Thalassobacillus sp. CUG 92003]